MKGKILRTDKEVHEYMNSNDGGYRFVKIELYPWYNPLRFIYGDYYWIVL